MDKKRTQRILGILVIIALVIILFPLLFGRNEAPTQTTSVQAPPFPDQQEAPTATTAAAADTSSPTVDPNAATPPTESLTPVVNAESDSNSVSNNDSDLPASTPTPTATKINDSELDSASDVSPSIAMDMNTRSQGEANEITSPKAKSASIVKVIDSEQEDETNDVLPVINDTPLKSAVAHKPKTVVSKSTSSKLTHKDLVKLNSSAWAVQMGSFKDKENARNLADKLRAAGYNAFIKEVKSPKGNIRTRVYIGPEFKQANAMKISVRVQQEMNLQGIVISYKPLAL